jgi:arylsulfatase
VEELDWSTGEVLKAIKDAGLDEKTLVIISSDNGPWLVKGKDAGTAGPLRDGKATVYEGGLREPFIARWPGKLPAGRVIDEPVIATDMFPTLLKLTGGDPAGRNLDGSDVWPVLAEGKKRDKVEFAFFQGEHLAAARVGDWKLHLPKAVKGTSAGLQLYNLASDVAEKVDRASSDTEAVREASAFGKRIEDSVLSDYRRSPNYGPEQERIRAAREKREANK